MTTSLEIENTTRRAWGIDALRGLAILLMILSGLEPFGCLPGWMYHVQCPPPSHGFNPGVAGISWVDLVFPFFIFSMGAAFPLALSRKLSKGQSQGAIAWSTIKRGLVLLSFAIFNWHMNPRVISSDPSTGIWFLGLFGFVLMIFIWGRWPWEVTVRANIMFKVFAVAIAAVVFSLLKYPDGSGFSLYKSNIILFVLADLAFFGALVWLFTRNNLLLRLGLIGVLFAIRVSFSVPDSWLSEAGSNYNVPFLAPLVKGFVAEKYLKYVNWSYNLSWVLQWRFLKYLFIIIPATVIGDLLVVWLKQSGEHDEANGFSNGRAMVIFSWMAAIIVATLTALKARWGGCCFIGLSVMAGVGFLLFKNAQSSVEVLMAKMYKWGVFWFILGLLFEPWEGGIKKDPSTMSYYFVASGLAIFTLIGFNIVADFFRKPKYLNLLIANGQNPMIAYASSSNLLNPIMAITGLQVVVNKISAANSWGGFAVALLLTGSLAIVVSLFTRAKIFLRT